MYYNRSSLSIFTIPVKGETSTIGIKLFPVGTRHSVGDTDGLIQRSSRDSKRHDFEDVVPLAQIP
jgi:hypothetical protein